MQGKGKIVYTFLSILVLISVMAAGISVAHEKDVEGAKDHPLISRYPGSFIKHYVVKDYDQYTLPLGVIEERKLSESKTLKGKITRIQYQAPEDVSTLQVFRNYEIALEKAGFDILFSASGKKLAEESSQWTRLVYPQRDAYAPLSGYSETQRYLAAKLARPEGDVYVSLYTVFADWGDVPYAQLDIIEVKPLQTGLVRVNAEAIAQDIKKTGRARIYGIYFDTGEATIKSSSEPVIEEIAKFLKQNPDIDLYVVGHTDSQGGFDYNMDLSRRRAESVIDRLVSEYGIDEGRLEAHGVGFLTPVATNQTEKGRAKNRRVELVEK